MWIANVNGTSLYYSDEGEGHPLIFIHGLCAAHEMFAPQVQAFHKTYRVICPDIRGNGGSGKLTGPIRTVLDRQCDDIAALLQTLHIEQAAFCGVSYGSVFTYHFVLRYPELVKALIIVGDATKVEVRYMKRSIGAIPISKLEIIKNSFDPSNLCQSETFNKLVSQFLTQIR